MIERCELGLEIQPLLSVEPLVSCEWLKASDEGIFLSGKSLQVCDRLIGVGVSVAFAVRHVCQLATGKRRLPVPAGVEALHRRKFERDWKRGPALLVPALDRIGGPSDTGSGQFTLQAANSLPNATGDHNSQGRIPLIVPDLSMQVFAKRGRFPSPMKNFDDLLRTQRNQHADDDDPHLARERTPAVQRLRKVEMDCDRPPAVTSP